MIDRNARRLAELLEIEFFAPIVGGNPDRLPPRQRALAADLKDDLAREREKLRNCGSAVALTREFVAYAAEHAAELDPQLSEVGFPTLGDLRYDVEKLAAELGLQWQQGRA